MALRQAAITIVALLLPFRGKRLIKTSLSCFLSWKGGGKRRNNTTSGEREGISPERGNSFFRCCNADVSASLSFLSPLFALLSQYRGNANPKRVHSLSFGKAPLLPFLPSPRGTSKPDSVVTYSYRHVSRSRTLLEPKVCKFCGYLGGHLHSPLFPFRGGGGGERGGGRRLSSQTPNTREKSHTFRRLACLCTTNTHVIITNVCVIKLSCGKVNSLTGDMKQWKKKLSLGRRCSQFEQLIHLQECLPLNQRIFWSNVFLSIESTHKCAYPRSKPLKAAIPAKAFTWQYLLRGLVNKWVHCT